MGTILYSGQPGTADAAIVTAPGSAATAIAHLFASNTTGGAVSVTVTIHRAISGSVETIANAVSVAANTMQDLLQDRLLALGELVLEPNDSLHASASAAASVTLTATA